MGEHRLQRTAWVSVFTAGGQLALRHVRSTLTRARTVLYISRVFIHCITRQVSLLPFFPDIYLHISEQALLLNLAPPLQALLPSIHSKYIHVHASQYGYVVRCYFHCYIYLFLSLLYCIHLVLYNFILFVIRLIFTLVFICLVLQCLSINALHLKILQAKNSEHHSDTSDILWVSILHSWRHAS